MTYYSPVKVYSPFPVDSDCPNRLAAQLAEMVDRERNLIVFAKVPYGSTIFDLPRSSYPIPGEENIRYCLTQTHFLQLFPQYITLPFLANKCSRYIIENQLTVYNLTHTLVMISQIMKFHYINRYSMNSRNKYYFQFLNHDGKGHGRQPDRNDELIRATRKSIRVLHPQEIIPTQFENISTNYINKSLQKVMENYFGIRASGVKFIPNIVGNNEWVEHSEKRGIYCLSVVYQPDGQTSGYSSVATLYLSRDSVRKLLPMIPEKIIYPHMIGWVSEKDPYINLFDIMLTYWPLISICLAMGSYRCVINSKPVNLKTVMLPDVFIQASRLTLYISYEMEDLYFIPTDPMNEPQIMMHPVDVTRHLRRGIIECTLRRWPKFNISGIIIPENLEFTPHESIDRILASEPQVIYLTVCLKKQSLVNRGETTKVTLLLTPEEFNAAFPQCRGWKEICPGTKYTNALAIFHTMKYQIALDNLVRI